MGLAAAAIVGGVASIGSAVIGSSAASSAAHTQADAANHAADVQQHMYDVTRGDLLPYNQAGQRANADITSMGPFDFSPTQSWLESTPGYQFIKAQGLKSVQNSATARGLGISGAALKGAATYATGLADSTYQEQFNNALTKYSTNLSRLQGQADLGENAAAQTGNYGTQTAANIGSAAIGAANARAAGTVGVANSIAGGLNGAANAFTANQYLSHQNDGMYATAYGSSPGAISEPYNQFDFSAANDPYADMFKYGS